MPSPLLEEVFKTSGVPSFTFVEPKEYADLLLSLRTPGRGAVIEGPSGIGKTTAVETALARLGMTGAVTKLSARRPRDVDRLALHLVLQVAAEHQRAFCEKMEQALAESD